MSDRDPLALVPRSPILPLPPEVAERIAAGEVVERPAAVVKELIENSLDAGADHIIVAVEGAGRTLIKVGDNGMGMRPEEMRMALARHATSKIRRFEDLEHLQTYGFRGEALPSIAAVSRMELMSRAEGEELGYRLSIEGGAIRSGEPVSMPVGTVVSVSHLFYNVPARRKFLRSDATEFKWIALVFKHFALAHPQVGFELYRDGEATYRLASGSMEDRLREFYGEDVVGEMVEVNFRSGYFEVKGYVGLVEGGRVLSPESFLFVNRRPVTHPRLAKAVQNALEPFVTRPLTIVYIINLYCPPDRCDVNVHPSKKEVKFADEQGAYSAMWAAIRGAMERRTYPLGLTSPPQVLTGTHRKAPSESQPSSPSGSPSKWQRIPIRSPSHLTPYTSLTPTHRGPIPPYPFPPAIPLKPEEVKREVGLSGELMSGLREGETLVETSPANIPQIFQVFDTYLVSCISSGVVFIDQHIAHERILYERALAAMESDPWPRQHLLFPVEFYLAPEDRVWFEDLLPLMRAMGLEVEQAEGSNFRILTLPTGIRTENERALLEGIVEEIRAGFSTGADPRHQLAAAFACHSAIKAGQPLEPEERVRLIDQLFLTRDPFFCPHGRPIIHILDRKEIDRWFKR